MVPHMNAYGIADASSHIDWRWAIHSRASDEDSAQASQLSSERRLLLEAAIARPVNVVLMNGAGS